MDELQGSVAKSDKLMTTHSDRCFCHLTPKPTSGQTCGPRGGGGKPSPMGEKSMGWETIFSPLSLSRS